MRPHRPPALARWLLERLGSTDEALVGDLLEEYLRRRSRTWYWRQVLMVILAGQGRDLRAHGVVAAKGAILSVVVIALSTLLGNSLTTWVGRRIWTGAIETGRDVFGATLYRLPLLASMCVGGGVGGWLLGRVDPAYRRAALISFLALPCLSTAFYVAGTFLIVFREPPLLLTAHFYLTRVYGASLFLGLMLSTWAAARLTSATSDGPAQRPPDRLR